MPIARVMNEPDDATPQQLAAATGQGGGDLNGTQATSILLGQAGTAASAIALPLKPISAGTTVTGVVAPAPLPPKPPG